QYEVRAQLDDAVQRGAERERDIALPRVDPARRQPGVRAVAEMEVRQVCDDHAANYPVAVGRLRPGPAGPVATTAKAHSRWVVSRGQTQAAAAGEGSKPAAVRGSRRPRRSGRAGVRVRGARRARARQRCTTGPRVSGAASNFVVSPTMMIVQSCGRM